MDEKSRKQHRRLWIVIVAVLLIPVILLGLYVVVTRNSVERRLQALRDAGYPASLAEWAEMHKLPDGVPNAAKIYEQAFNQIVYPVNDGNIPIFGSAALPDWGVVWSEPILSDVAQCLQDNQQCLALLRQASEIDQCRYNWSYLPTAPDLSMFRECLFLLELELHFRAQQGRTEVLVPCFKTIVALSDSLRYEPTVIPYLTRMSTVQVLVRDLQWILSNVSLTEAELLSLEGLFANEAKAMDLAEVMVGHRCEVIEVFRNSERLSAYLGRPRAAFRVPGAMTTGLLDMLDYMADLIEITKLPRVDQYEAFKSLDAEQYDLPFWHVAIKQGGIASLGQIGRLDVQMRVHIDLARTALAIERYRLVTGEVPSRLDVLVPKYLDAVPIDPFDGKSIRYRPTEPGYVLYSINDDGQDNGGKERDKKNKNSPYDLCFIVTR